MKVIFLDIDGVMNSSQFYREKRSNSWEWRHMSGKYLSYAIDPNAVNLLNQIKNHTGAEIILSSSWRLGPSLSVLKSDFLKNNIAIYDRTPCWGKYGIMDWTETVDEKGDPHYILIPRGEIINKYISEHPEIENYVILDDVDEFTREQHKHLVLTDADVGLTSDDVQKAINILNMYE